MIPLPEQVTQLVMLMPTLGPKDQLFATSLITSYQKGHLSKNQEPWIIKLIDRAAHIKAGGPTIDVGAFGKVLALFTKAKEHLKYPKITLKCMDVPIVISVAGKGSKNPGTINIMGTGTYPHRKWYGRVTVEGVWKPAQDVSPELLEALQELLMEFGEQPGEVAKKYGQMTGNCCFCNKGLSDPNSVAAGYGPVCAEHYGLTWAWKHSVLQSEGGDTKSVKAVVPDSVKLNLNPKGVTEQMIKDAAVQTMHSVAKVTDVMQVVHPTSAELVADFNKFELDKEMIDTPSKGSFLELAKEAAVNLDTADELGIDLTNEPHGVGYGELNSKMAALKTMVKTLHQGDDVPEAFTPLPAPPVEWEKSTHLDVGLKPSPVQYETAFKISAKDQMKTGLSKMIETLKEEAKLVVDSDGVEWKLQKNTVCYFCESAQEPFTIKEGLPVCSVCLTEMEG